MSNAVHAERRVPRGLTAALALLPALLVSCEGDDGATGPPGASAPAATTPTAKSIDKDEAAPGVNIAITGVSGAGGATGNFAVGDTLSVTFTALKDDGSRWDITEFSFARAMVSGPTFNYQRVLAEVNNVATAAVENADGSWTYTFASAIPATYLAPLNDTASFDADDGELQGQALLDGTYTVGMYFAFAYDVDGAGLRDVGDATFDFLLGTTVSALDTRAVVTRDACNRCHSDLQFHGGLRRNATLCLLCHTAGSEDRNTGGATPGASIDFRIMVHKIHNAAHLPSVVGMTTDMSGVRDYTAAPVPYELVGFGGAEDFSHIAFPAWPNFDEPMPRDMGHGGLGGTNQTKEDTVRRGVTSCYLCHGDPDGAGPIQAPAQGGLAFSQPSRQACGSCHDDWVFDRPYTANGQTMPPQATDGACTLCHVASGNGLAVEDAHLHPLLDPTFATGFNVEITAVTEAGTNDGDGTIDTDEKVAVTFTIRDDMGADISPAALNQLNFAVNGPTSNYNVVEQGAYPLAALTGPQPFTAMLPKRVLYEYVGDDTGGTQTYAGTALTPHWNVSGALTEVRTRTGLGAGSTTLAAAASAPGNFIDVVNAAGFARDDFIVIDDGTMAREYQRIQTVQGNRLWFGSTSSTTYSTLRTDHPMGAAVQEVTTAVVAGGNWSLNAMTGAVTELVDFANGSAVLVSYTTDFVMPAEYPVAINGGPDLTERQGGWAGKSIVSGTYSVTLWGRIDRNFTLFGETTSYRDASEGTRFDFRVGDAATVEPYDLVSSRDNCYACHVSITFHGRSRRGFDTCIACHGNAAGGDRPQYVAANAPATDGVGIDFAELIHKVHRGADLADASTYVVVGFGGAPYPNNFGQVTFEEVRFPAFPTGTKDCALCHGEGNTAFRQPSDLDHPTEQVQPSQGWRLVCGSCHDSAAELAHIESQTSPVSGAESCELCHGPNQQWAVEVMHMIR